MHTAAAVDGASCCPLVAEAIFPDDSESRTERYRACPPLWCIQGYFHGQVIRFVLQEGNPCQPHCTRHRRVTVGAG